MVSSGVYSLPFSIQTEWDYAISQSNDTQHRRARKKNKEPASYSKIMGEKRSKKETSPPMAHGHQLPKAIPSYQIITPISPSPKVQWWRPSISDWINFIPANNPPPFHHHHPTPVDTNKWPEPNAPGTANSSHSNPTTTTTIRLLLQWPNNRRKFTPSSRPSATS